MQKSSAQKKVMLTIEEVSTATLKSISVTTKVILATEEVTTATPKVISATTKVILANTATRLPIYNFVSFDYNLTFSHTAAILDSKMVSIAVFSNYGDVKQIHVDKI